MTFATLALLHAVPTLYMVGVIWCVQRVHYPLFAAVGAERFADYEREHCRRIGPVVMPAMLAEAAASAAVFWWAPADATLLAGFGLGLLAVVWASTFLLQVPCHRRLEQGFDVAAWRRLVAGNVLRTAAWSGRGVLAVLLCLSAQPPA